MKNMQSKEKFIDLRAQGYSFDSIAMEIGVSKPTLIKWNQECADAVANLFYIHVDSLLEHYKLLKTHRIEMFASFLGRAQDELKNRDLNEIATKDLIALIFNFQHKLACELASLQYHTGESESKFGADFELFKEKMIPLNY